MLLEENANDHSDAQRPMASHLWPVFRSFAMWDLLAVWNHLQPKYCAGGGGA